MREKMCLALLLAGALLAGCAAGEQPAASARTAQSAARVAAESRELTEEEILAAYGRAVGVYEWFDLSTLPSEGPFVEADGGRYQRVVYAGIGTVDELRSYLRSIFSQELTEQLLGQDGPRPRYRDIDGALYVQPGTRGADFAKGDISASVERVSEEEYLVNVTVDLLDDDLTTVTGVACYSFPYQQIEGRWVFTEFHLVY